MSNLDKRVVASFGAEWCRLVQTAPPSDEAAVPFDARFARFVWHALPRQPVGADVGCGGGRWARLVAPQVGTLRGVDRSADALGVATRALADQHSVPFRHASVDELPFDKGTLDFAYSFGVLHDGPDKAAATSERVARPQPCAPLLCGLHFRFDNRPWWYSLARTCSAPVRFVVSCFTNWLRYLLSECIAAAVYRPLPRRAAIAERSGLSVDSLPLSFYRRRPYYVLRTDALDRFGTRLERRFTRSEIEAMARDAGLERIQLNDHAPFWCFVGFGRATAAT